MSTPTTAKPIRVQKGMFDLSTFEDVTLVKEGTFTPANTMHEAHERLGGNADKLLEAVNRGLLAEYQSTIKNDPNIPWKQLTEDGKTVEFTGQPADEKLVNTLVLALAKSSFGYDKDASIEERRAAKEAAKNLIRDTPPIREGLVKQAAKAAAENDEE